MELLGVAFLIGAGTILGCFLMRRLLLSLQARHGRRECMLMKQHLERLELRPGR